MGSEYSNHRKSTRMQKLCQKKIFLAIFYLNLLSIDVCFGLPNLRDHNEADTPLNLKKKSGNEPYRVRADEGEKVEFKYGVVVDCGSTGSRAHIYRWPSSAVLPNGRLDKEIRPMLDPKSGEPLVKKIRPGLSTFKDQPESASDYMKPIMDFISDEVPSEAQKETPIYFLATAGLRMLDHEKQHEILNDISQDLKKDYNFPLIFTQVISGAEEGEYMWLSANVNANRLGKDYNQVASEFFTKNPKNRRFGVLEIGGASAQVTYDLNSTIDTMISSQLRPFPQAYKTYQDSVKKFSLNSEHNDYRIFSTTFLGFGTNSARGLAIDLLVRDAMRPQNLLFPGMQLLRPIFFSPGSTLLLEDPCLPSGAHQAVEKPIDLLVSGQKTIGFVVEPNDQTFIVRLIGNGNYLKCRQLLERVVQVAQKERLNCDEDESDASICPMTLIGTNFVPFMFIQFLGFSELYYTTNEVIDSPGPFKLPVILGRTLNICSTSFHQLLKRYPDANRNDPNRVLLECFKATWMLTWLQTVLRMPYNFMTDLQTVTKVYGNSIDWTLGAIIDKTMNSQPVEVQPSPST